MIVECRRSPTICKELCLLRSPKVSKIKTTVGEAFHTGERARVEFIPICASTTHTRSSNTSGGQIQSVIPAARTGRGFNPARGK